MGDYVGVMIIVSEQELFYNRAKTEKLYDKIVEAQGSVNPSERRQFNKSLHAVS